jgi:ubiquinone/menaquinone biosynthesis C-methylase UbiE
MSRSYFNEKSAIWDATIVEKDVAKLIKMADRLGIKPDFVVLDVGTGTGIFVPFLLGKTGENGKLVCIDFAEKMLAEARSKGFRGNIEYLQADITTTPLHGEAFDLVVCYSSFPHFQDKPKALSEIRRVLKEGGRLVICHTSSRAVINEIHRNIPAVEHDIIPESDEMQAMLLEAGFGDIQIDDAADNYYVGAIKPEMA